MVYAKLSAKFRLDRFILSSSVGKTPQFLPFFWTSALNFVASWQPSDKVKHVCTTTNLPLSNGIKIVSVHPAFMAKSGAQSLTFKSMANKQTDKHTDKKLNVFGHPGGG